LLLLCYNSSQRDRVMGGSMIKVVTVAQMQAIERETDLAGVSYSQMMENAGQGVADAVGEVAAVRGCRVLILVGPGNNGGDGLVAGRLLAESGADVQFYLSRPRGDDDANYARVISMGVPTLVAADDPQGDQLAEAVASADVLIDALLGTGADRPIQGDLKALLERCGAVLRASREFPGLARGLVSPVRPTPVPTRTPVVIAVDCPSGLNCDTGQLDPVAMAADLTVTFDCPKAGQFRFPGATAVGDLVVADIGSPPDLATRAQVRLELATADGVRNLLPTRPLDAHKGTFGKVMIAAGSLNYTGAAALAGEAAYRAGAGLVTMAVPSAIHAPLAARLAEATFVLLPHEMGAISENAARVLLPAADGYDALLVGPGLGREAKTGLFLRRLLAGDRAADHGRLGFARPAGREELDSAPAGHRALPPLVVDADGLNLLAEMGAWQALLPPATILTPHPGEMARLLGRSVREVTEDRVTIAAQAAVQWGQVVVLKGPFTVVASPESRATLIPFANPALATAGSGDVLAGVIAALLGMGMEASAAAIAGAYLHAAAGARAAADIGAAGVNAGDLPWYVAAVLAEMGR